MPSSKERVAEFLKSTGLPLEIREFDVSTKNSFLAAQALGCTVAEIAKSVVFMGDGAKVVVLSGDRRVDAVKLSSAVGAPVVLATPDQVREYTGFPIGGVPPFPHEEGVKVLADASLMRFESVWAAGGAPNVVFRVATRSLFQVLGSEPVDVSSQTKG